MLQLTKVSSLLITVSYQNVQRIHWNAKGHDFYFNYLFQKSKILKTRATLRLQTESILNFYDFKRLIHSTKELPSHLQIFESYLCPFPPGWILPDEEQSRWRDLGRWSAYESSHQLIDALSPTTVSLDGELQIAFLYAYCSKAGQSTIPPTVGSVFFWAMYSSWIWACHMQSSFRGNTYLSTGWSSHTPIKVCSSEDQPNLRSALCTLLFRHVPFPIIWK